MATMDTSFGPVSYSDEGSGSPILLLHYLASEHVRITA